MARRIPKLSLRQGIRERTPPPLIKWDLNEYERERWEALTAHQKALLKKNMKTSTDSFYFEDKSSNFIPRPVKSISKATETSNSPQTSKPSRRADSSEPNARPLMMPNLHVEHIEFLPQAQSLLEQAERFTATEAIDQTSLRFQVRLRRNLELMHEEDLKTREEQWKEKIAITRSTLEDLKKRNLELESVMNKYLVSKGTESEGSREISRLLELKVKYGDDINGLIAKKTGLEKNINELHVELEKTTFSFENNEKTLQNQLEVLQRQVTMSENEKLDSVVFNKENLKRRKDELLRHRQELVEKWQGENQDFQEIFERTDVQRNDIKMQIKHLKAEKELMKKEKEILANKELQVIQEKEVQENNKKTMKMHHFFEDPSVKKNSEIFKSIISATAEKILKNTSDESELQGANELTKYLLEIKKQHQSRKKELLKNSSSQIVIISERITEEENKKLKAFSNLHALKSFLKK